MRHFPIFLDLRDRRVLVSGAGETAMAKLRMILKSEAGVHVFGAQADPQIRRWASEGRLTLAERPVEAADLAGAALVYAANEDSEEDGRVARVGREVGALVNIVDDLSSDFITPAIVDRDPVTVAIGTEGAAPVLARRIKAENEERLSPSLGVLARAGQAYRPEAEALPTGRARRRFWSRYYEEIGPRALREGGADALRPALEALLAETLAEGEALGRVSLVGAGPGDPELLTLRARRLLHEADVVVTDRLVGQGVLELARREARIVEVGKMPGGPSWKQEDINALLIEEAEAGHHVVRLKSGDPSVFGRLDEELDALELAGVETEVAPGITSASAAAASIKTSLTRRGRNSEIRFLTGQDVKGFAEQDWRGLSAPGATAAIYMGVRAARFIQGRLMLHGADPETPVTAIENASRPDEKVVSAPLKSFPTALQAAGVTGPAILFLGIAPRKALTLADNLAPELSAPATEAAHAAGA